MRSCLVCAFPLEEHPACAVCDVPLRNGASAPLHVMCAFCRSEDANSLWSSDDRSRVGAAEDAIAPDLAAPMMTIGELSTHRRPRGPKAKKKQRVLRLLYARDVVVTVRRIDDLGRFRGYYTRREAMSRRAIARRVQCSHTYVNRLFREAISCTFPRR